jgi:Domain of unknown function (DUF4214)/RTX calcium-binding nonapeptide repeat (4 copies)
MAVDYKLTCIIVDDFTTRSISEFAGYDIQYYDYAKSYTSYTSDYHGKYNGYDYGDVDSSGILQQTVDYDWFNLNSLTGQSLSSFTEYSYAGASTGNLTGLYYGYDPEVVDNYYYDNIDAINSWTQATPGHGDWVLKAFTDSLNDKSDVEIIAVDIDYDSSGDLDSLFATTTLNGNAVPFLTWLYTNSALNDLHQANESHLLVGINASFTYSSTQAISAVNNLISGDMFIVQAAPNVNSPGTDWGQYLTDVINVGAWNVDSNNYVLAADINSIDTVDVYANGYIQRAGWGEGSNFGTSFATPRVFGGVVNYFDSEVLPLLDSRALELPDPSYNLSQAEETIVTNEIISAISSKYLVTLSGLENPLGPLNISLETINDYGAQPIVVPISSPDFGYTLTSVQQFANHSPTGSVTITGTPVQGETLTASNSISDTDGIGSITYRWYASGSDTSIGTGSTYTLTETHVGKTITVKAEYIDGYETSETVVSAATNSVSNITAPTANLMGTASADTLTGGAGDDLITGLGGTDLLYASSGNDILDGGDGRDTVSYSGNGSDYTFSKVGDAWQFYKPSGSGTDTVYNNVERLSFADGTLGLDTVSGSSGVMYRLYKAAFDRVPDAPGLGHNIRLMDGGLTLAQMSDAFVVSAEFTNTYGALSNAQFINQLYLNVLDRTPDAPGLAWNVNLLNTTHTRHEMLSGFSESAENQAAVIGQIQDGIWFT